MRGKATQIRLLEKWVMKLHYIACAIFYAIRQTVYNVSKNWYLNILTTLAFEHPLHDFYFF